ncbi:hypothetical protein C9988_03120 [Pseudidiomarina aestuarii]|nr:hypothetical protein C9988_03120 [Pseudidiomarina aestuarii]
MTLQTTSPDTWLSPAVATKIINASAKLWFATVLIGQVIFSAYIVAFYYSAAAANELELFSTVMPAGYIEGDFWGNVAVVGHVIFAAAITVGGLLQLIPHIRSKVPALHRWNGRLYISIALIMSLSGAFMLVTRYDKVAGDMFGHIALMLNGVIIVTCAFFAFKYARQKQFAIHRHWALRLFLAVSGVWLFRVGLMAWLSLHQAPVGFDPTTFSGPFLNVLYVLVYLMPLVFLEFYLRAQARGSVNQKVATAIGVVVISCVIILGTIGATLGMWFPQS